MPGHAHRLGLEYDVERAAKLLAEAGHPDGRDLPELRVAAAARPTALVEIGRQWRELGIRCHFERLPLSEIADAVDRGAHLWLQGFVGDFPDPDGFLPPVARVLDAYHGEIAAQLERARSLPDRDERLRLYQQVDRRLVREEVRVIPMWYGANITARRPWVRTWANALSDAQLDEVFVER
jgi:ABC-type transport system substrate-binding protein